MRVVQRQSVLQAIVEEEQEVEEPVLHVKVVGSISSVCRSEQFHQEIIPHIRVAVFVGLIQLRCTS